MRQYGVSRTVYYKYLYRYITYGIEGLRDKEKSFFVMPNATKKNVVDKVLDIAKKYPTYKPKRLANELGGIVCAKNCIQYLGKA